MSGPLALIGGDELKRGNEPQDRLLVEAAVALGGPAYVLATAAAQHRPDMAVRNARSWFGSLGLDVEELPVLSRDDAGSVEIAQRASEGSFFYLVGGEPGHVLEVLRDSRVWDAIVGAWRRGAALAGSSAGAMAMAGTMLLPGGRGREAVAGLGLVPGIAVIPHRNTFGASWESSGITGLSDDVDLLGLGERTAVVFEEGEWRTLGDGRVSILSHGSETTFGSGETVVGLPDPA